MAEHWFYRYKRRELGPLTLEELQFLADGNQISELGEIRRGEQGIWQDAGEVVKQWRPADEPPFSSPLTVTPSESAVVTNSSATIDPQRAPPAIPSVKRRSGPIIDDNSQPWLIVSVSVLGVLLSALLVLVFWRSPTGSGERVANGKDRAGETAPTDVGGTSDKQAPDTKLDRPIEPNEPAAPDSTDKSANSITTDPSKAVESTPSNPVPENNGESSQKRVDQSGFFELRPPAAGDSAQGPPSQTATARSTPGGNKPGGNEETGHSRFFGVEGKGKKIAYIVDCSSSMRGLPYQKACEELLRSTHALKEKQNFFVVFFSNVTYPQFFPNLERKLLPATPGNKSKLQGWVQKSTPGGGTDPRDALIMALDLKPDIIYLLTDGEFPTDVVTTIRDHNAHGVVIHTIAFVNRSGELLLQQIATENRGKFQFIP